jgi:hypothetical protein
LKAAFYQCTIAPSVTTAANAQPTTALGQIITTAKQIKDKIVKVEEGGVRFLSKLDP